MRHLAAVLCLLGFIGVACNSTSTASNQSANTSASQPTSATALRGLRTVRDVPLQGNTSRFDYASFDPQAHRLYIAHLGDGTVSVYDTRSGAAVGEIKNVPGVHGVLAVPELGKVYATATDKNQVAVIDPGTLSVVATVDGGDYPDGLAYDPEVGKLYVSDEHGGTDTVIDVRSNTRMTRWSANSTCLAAREHTASWLMLSSVAHSWRARPTPESSRWTFKLDR